MGVGFGTVLFSPFGKDVLRVAPVVLRHRPGTRECVVNHGDLVMGDVRIGLVDVKAFLDDGLVVSVQRNAGGVEGTRTAEAARLNDEHVVFAISVFIDPLAYGRAEERWFQVHRPRATIRKDSAVMIVLEFLNN